MKIAGIVKTSFVDYPGKICTTVFTPGCNMNCWYCHNYLLLQKNTPDYYEEAMNYLTLRKGLIDAVTITGGEATLQPDLEEFIKTVKEMGYLIKLDTNGLRPDVLKRLLSKNLLDYVAMDVKAPLHKYNQVTRVNIKQENLLKSIELLKNANIDYEFRTTFTPDLTLEDINEIGTLVEGAKNFSLQKYNKPNKEGMLEERPREEVKKAYEILLNYVKNATLKGL